MACSQCNLLPEDPSVRMLNRRTGQYHNSLCYGCSQFTRPQPDDRYDALYLEVDILRKAVADKKVIVKREYIEHVPAPKGKYNH